MGELEGAEGIADAIFDCVVRNLLNAPGFDDFWWGIDQDYRSEVCSLLRKEIERTLVEESTSYTATTGFPVQGWPA
jgi:hypothetical protein